MAALAVGAILAESPSRLSGITQATSRSRSTVTTATSPDRFTLDVGGRYDLAQNVALLLQLNALWRGRDSGEQAEPEDSGGKYLFLSPGISVMVARNVQLFAIAQLPLYASIGERPCN